MASSVFLQVFLLSLIATLTWAHTHHPGCGHAYFNETIGHIEVEELPLPGKGARNLQSSTGTTTSSFPNIRITPDYSLLVNGSSDFISYVKTSLMPPVISYFQSALRVKQPLTSPLTLPKYLTSICGYPTPSVLYSGVATDFYLIVSSSSDSNNWVASAGSCFLSQGNNRPIIARMLFNLVYTQSATNDIMLHEQNIYLTIHEMFHAFGFTASSFPYFIDSNGNTIPNTVKNITLNGSVRSVLNVEPLTTNLRNYFGCSSLPGAIMENDGGAGTAGSHFERRYFLYEVMTSGVIDGYRVSNFSLNVLEASGWYVPNYTYAEPFFFGQGEGCGFINQDCSTAIYNFDEYCSVASRGCAAAGRGGGSCSSDSRSDGCYYMFPMVDYDCDTANAAVNARLPSVEVYGRGLNSKCFTGTLTTASKASQTSFCFKYTCSGSGLNTVVQVAVGSQTVICKAQGTATVKGYNGVINCPDPLSFCSTAGKAFCPRNCLGRGNCVNNQCVCNTGFTGVDCGLNSS